MCKAGVELYDTAHKNIANLCVAWFERTNFQSSERKMTTIYYHKNEDLTEPST